MSARALRPAADPAEADAPGVRRSVRVKTAAQSLDMNERDVRQLLADGELEGHRVGKRGVRIYADSIATYQARRPLTGTAAPNPVTEGPPAPVRHPAYREALAYLHKHGLG